MSLAAVVRVRALTSAEIIKPHLLGTAPSRFFHLGAPQNCKRPYVVYRISEGSPAHHLLGAGGLWQGEVELEIYADKAADMEMIVEEIRLTCDGFRGPVVVDSNTWYVRRLHWISQNEDVVYLDAAKPLPTFHASISLALDVTQSIPTF